MANQGPNIRGEETRRKLLDSGMREFHSVGFWGTGVDAIARRAKVPKGSFYNHYESKRSFTVEVVDYYFDRHLAKLREFLENDEMGGLDRLGAYFNERIEFFRGVDAKRGCLMGNLSLEIADQEEAVRQRLAVHFDTWSNMFAACIEEAQESGAMRNGADAKALGNFVLNSWEGAILRMKACGNVKPLEEARKMIFEVVLT
ncbi:TetR/AcrR family transcriptional regulator [soil metagenome]